MNEEAIPAQDSKAEASVASRSENQPIAAPRPKRRRRTLALLAIAVSLLPFVVLEAGLRFFGVADDQADVHAGFGDTSPLFVLDEDEGVYRTSLSKEQFFVPQEFSARHDSNEFRIFTLGGSTVQGRPFGADTSFAKWLELHLHAETSGTNCTSVNCGGVSYASYRLRPVLREVLNYQPDLIILATGHNEFLEDRTYASVKSRSTVRLWLEDASSNLRTIMLLRNLLGGAPRIEPTQDRQPISETVEARLDDEAGYASYHRDPEWHDQVCQQYRDSVAEMVQMCKAADVPILLVNLGSNLRDCPPFKSELPTDLADEEQRKWQNLFDVATERQQTSCDEALKIYMQLLEIDSLNALLHFRIARCQEQLGRLDDARHSYQRALDYDVCPLRMSSRLQQILREVAEGSDVPLVDAAAAVDAASLPDSIPGYDVYLDHVHPGIGSHQVIARTILHRLQTEGLVRTKTEPLREDSPRTSDRNRHLYRDHLRRLPNAYFSNGRRRIGWLENWAQRQRLFQETIPIDNTGEVAAAVRYAELNDFTTAAEHLLIGTLKDAVATERLLTRCASLFSEGQTEITIWLLRELSGVVVNGELRSSIDLADLVIAVDTGHATAAAGIFERHRDQWQQIVDADTTTWRDVMPDVLNRTQKLMESR